MRLTLPTDVLIRKYVGVASHLVFHGECCLVVKSWPLVFCTGVLGIAACAMSVKVGCFIVIRLILLNSGGVDIWRINGSVGHVACYFCCNRCGKSWVSGGCCIGLVVSL